MKYGKPGGTSNAHELSVIHQLQKEVSIYAIRVAFQCLAVFCQHALTETGILRPLGK